MESIHDKIERLAKEVEAENPYISHILRTIGVFSMPVSVKYGVDIWFYNVCLAISRVVESKLSGMVGLLSPDPVSSPLWLGLRPKNNGTEVKD